MDNDLKFAVNTNWDLFQHSQTKTFYLRYNQSWLTATDVKGRGSRRASCPTASRSCRERTRTRQLEGREGGASGQVAEGLAGPKVFVSTTPAELILLRGAPSYLTVGNTELLWVNNTESDVFRMGKTGPVYFLISGRWFSAPDFTGPWTFATPSLPDDFKKIPLSHDRSRVLASVPGTDQAAEAVLLAQIPQTATVEQEAGQGARGGVRRRHAAVPADREDDPRARGEHRQGHHQGRRPLLHVLPGRLVHGQEPDRAVGSDRLGAGRDLQDPGQLAVVQRHLRHRPGRQGRHGRLRRGGRLHRHDDRVGLRRLGQRLLLPAVLRLRRLLPVLPAVLPDLRVPRVVQPVDRRLQPRRLGVRSVRRRRRRRELQPEDRHLRARRRGLRSVRVARRGHGVQPAHRDGRRDEAGLERLRQLGTDRRRSAAISGRPRRASPTTAPARRRA